MNARVDTPQVARVLLVAHPSRQAEFGDWLRVEGDEVSYELCFATPEAVPFERVWDVVVLDGESLFEDRLRRRVMRRLAQRPREASVLFVCSRLPHERELADAEAWADDFIYSGWAQAQRVRSRVLLVALAPWRRSSAIRRRAEVAGDARLRVLFGGASSSRRIGGSEREQITTSQARLASEVFNEGRRIAVTDIQQRVDRICKELLEEVAIGRDCPEAARSIEDTYRDVRAPVVAARFGGVDAAVHAVWGTLRKVVREELAEIERAQVGGS